MRAALPADDADEMASPRVAYAAFIARCLLPAASLDSTPCCFSFSCHLTKPSSSSSSRSRSAAEAQTKRSRSSEPNACHVHFAGISCVFVLICSPAFAFRRQQGERVCVCVCAPVCACCPCTSQRSAARNGARVCFPSALAANEVCFTCGCRI